MKAKNMTKRLFAGLLAAAMVFTSAPMTQTQAAKKQTTITVKTQAELNAALAKKGVKSIVIKTSKNVTLKIANAASKANLVIDAPKATISNNAKLAGITIKDAKTFTERSKKGNSITVTDKKLSLTVAKTAQNVSVKSAAKDAKISLKVNGEMKKLTVDKKADISVKGSTDQTVTIVNNAKGSAVDVKVESAKMSLTKPADVKIAEGTNITKLTVKTDANIEVAKGATVDKVVVTGKNACVAIQADGAVGTVDVNSKAEVALTGSTDKKVELNVNAKDASVSTAVKTEVNVNADAEVSIEKGAEGSSVAKADGVETKVSNASDDKIVVTDSNGNESSVDAGKTAISNDEGTKEEAKEENKQETKKEETTDNSYSSSTGSSSSSNSHIGIQSFQVSPTTKNIVIGETVQINPVFVPVNATNKYIYWTVSNANASVDNYGRVTGRAEGTCVVTATTDEMGHKASCTVTISKPTLTGIQLNAADVSMVVGETLSLTAAPIPQAADLGTLTWTSSDSAIATVYETGYVTAVAVGTTDITVSSGQVSKTITVTVSDVADDQIMITLKKDESTEYAKKAVASGTKFETISITAPELEGKTFTGWKIDGDSGETVTSETTFSSDTTLVAQWETKKCKVYYHYTTGSKTETVDYGNHALKTLTGEEIHPAETILGWSTVANATSKQYEMGQSVWISEDTHFYIVSKTRQVKLTLAVDGDSGLVSEDVFTNDWGHDANGDLYENYLTTVHVESYLPYNSRLMGDPLSIKESVFNGGNYVEKIVITSGGETIRTITGTQVFEMICDLPRTKDYTITATVKKSPTLTITPTAACTHTGDNQVNGRSEYTATVNTGTAITDYITCKNGEQAVEMSDYFSFLGGVENGSVNWITTPPTSFTSDTVYVIRYKVIENGVVIASKEVGLYIPKASSSTQE